MYLGCIVQLPFARISLTALVAQSLRECGLRLEQVKQSIQPNGVVQPIPTNAVAPATTMFHTELNDFQ